MLSLDQLTRSLLMNPAPNPSLDADWDFADTYLQQASSAFVLSMLTSPIILKISCIMQQLIRLSRFCWGHPFMPALACSFSLIPVLYG